MLKKEMQGIRLRDESMDLRFCEGLHESFENKKVVGSRIIHIHIVKVKLCFKI
jgi:hypothetical protein